MKSRSLALVENQDCLLSDCDHTDCVRCESPDYHASKWGDIQWVLAFNSFFSRRHWSPTKSSVTNVRTIWTPNSRVSIHFTIDEVMMACLVALYRKGPNRDCCEVKHIQKQVRGDLGEFPVRPSSLCRSRAKGHKPH